MEHNLITSLLAVIISTSTVLGIVWKIMLPHLKETINAEHEERITKLEEKTKDLVKINNRDKSIIKALIAILRHLETGNSTGEMIKARDTLAAHIIDEM